MKKMMVSLVAAGTLLCMVPAGFAASDIDKHWSKSYIESLHENSIMNPSDAGEFKPDQAITRAEFMRYINRAMNFTEKTVATFTDVDSDAWYYETICIAVNYGYIDGVGNQKMAPESTLTREQAATILGRLHKYKSENSVSGLDFIDRDKISTWSQEYIVDAVSQGYLAGYTDGSLKPQGEITRGEIAKILYFFTGTPMHKKDTTYTGTSLISDTNNITIGTQCALSGVTVNGNLYITEGNSGTVELSEVTVTGKIIVSGGDVVLSDVNAKEIIVSSPMKNAPSITLEGNTSVSNTQVMTTTTLSDSDLTTSAGGFSKITTTGEGIDLFLNAKEVWSLTVEEKAEVTASEDTAIGILTAKAPVIYNRGKSIQEASLLVSGCEIVDLTPQKVSVGSGVTAKIQGETVKSEYQVVVTPATLQISADAGSLSHSYDLTFSGHIGDVGTLTLGSTRLKLGTDYTALNDGSGIRIYKTFLQNLEKGTHRIDIVMDNKDKGYFTIDIMDTDEMVVTPKQFTFDIYQKSNNYIDMAVVISTAKGTTLSSVNIDNKSLARGDEYSYNVSTGAVVVYREALSKLSEGEHTITYQNTQGSKATTKIGIVNTKPVNKLNVTSVDFDATKANQNKLDVSVKLTFADGATLTKIRCNGVDLEENWQYKISGDTVTISKTAITKFVTNNAQYADFVFGMSTGESPVLRINFVTTYQWDIKVTDDLGNGLEGIQVDVIPVDKENGTTPSPVKTNQNGIATVYVKNGDYKAIASGTRIAESVQTNEVRIGSKRETVLKANVLETLTLTITNSFGAKLEGATVLIDGKTLTAGSDGVVVFTLPRGDYSAQISKSGYATTVKAYKLTASINERVELQ